MSSGTWLNNDNLYLKFGTAKATASTGGEFLYPAAGGNRVIEFLLDLTTLNTSTATIIEDNLFYPTGMFLEAVELVVETAAVGSTATLSVGTMRDDRVTAASGTAFVNALAVTALTPAGTKLTLTAGSTGAGGYIGAATTLTDGKAYISAKAGTAVFSAGLVRVRLFYHSNATITQ